MTVDKSNIVISINPLLPRLDHIQTIAGARETRRIELEFPLLDDLGAVLLDQIPDDTARLVQPLLDVVGLVPPGWPHGSLGTRLE